MSGRILDDNNFEGLKFYESDSLINKEVTPLMRQIMSRLFRGTEINLDDFYFTVFEDKEANAYFLGRGTSLAEKNIIAISRGLIEDCNNEDELAAIIGHECGHYLWAQILGGENTIFQERASDLRAVDLMINGGYNPLHHLNVCGRLFSYGGHQYSDICLDVHGNGLARVEDIKARLTMIANEKGDFAVPDDKPDKEYLAIKEKARQAYEKEGYDTYIEKCLKNVYGSKDAEKLSAEQILGVIYDELEAGNLATNVRRFEIYDWVEKLDNAKRFDVKSPELVDLCQKIFTKMHDAEAALPWNEKIKENLAKNNVGMLYHFKLEPFGDFAKQIENVKNFANYKSKEDVMHYAREMYKLKWTLGYINCFKDVKYATIDPKGKDNIGKKLPIDEFVDFLREIPESDEDHRALAWAIDSVGLGNRYAERYCYSDSYDHDEYFLDENKIVLAFGEEARRLNTERRMQALSRQFMTECENSKNNFDKKIEFYDKLAQFSQSENEAEKKALALELSEYFSDKDVRYDLDTPIFNFNTRAANPYYLRNPYIQEIYDRFNDSPTKKYFCDNLDGDSENIFRVAEYRERLSEEKRFREIIVDDEEKLERALATLKDKNMYADISRKTDKYNHREFREKVCTSLMELADYVALQNERKAVHIYGLIDEQLVKFSKPVFDYGDEQHKKDVKEMEDKFKNSIRVIQQKKLRRASKLKEYVRFPMLYRSSSTTQLDSTVLENFRYREFSEILKNAMEAYGFDYNADMETTLARLDHLTGRTAKTSLFAETPEMQQKLSDMRGKDETLNFWRGAGILVAANAIREGKDFDLKNMLKYIRDCETSSYYAPVITDILAEAIQKHNKFHSLPLQDKLYVYETMNDLDLFSEKYINKSEFFKSIVKDIEKHPNHDEAMQITEKLLSLQYAGRPLHQHKLKSHDIEFAKEKDALIDFYVKGKAAELGIDDGSDAYYEKAKETAEEICAQIQVAEGYYDGRLRYHEKFPRVTLQFIMKRLSNEIVSQELTSQMLADIGCAKFSQKDAEDFDITARCAEGIISTLAKSSEAAKTTIDFLSKKCTPESIDEVFEKLPKNYDLRRGAEIKVDGVANHNITLDNSALQLLHDNFWHADLPIRAYLMNRILKAYSSKDEDVLNLVVDMHFDEKSPYYKEAKRVVKTVFNHLKPYERNLILAALVSANQRDKENVKTGGEAIGEGLKMFFENKGPAFVKFGQLLSYLPVLDPDIRKPLAQLRDKADIPDRADLFKLMKETLPNEELAKIGRVDKILGAGSFFITTKIEYEDKPCVVALMRPYAKDLAQSGMDMIYDTIVDLSNQDVMYKPLLNIATQARLSAMSETDIEADYAKFTEAVKIYDDVKITTPQGEYEPEVAKWISYGKGKDDQVYKILTMAEGQAMTSAKMSEQTKHDMAVAYVALELTNLLSGSKWDTDRHQGQQNLAENGFKKFVIGIFDTGAQMQNSPKFKDKVLLGELLYGMARAARNGESIADYMVNKVKDIDKAGDKLNFNTLYIDEVQRGLTALSDIITYQKEVKDDKGKVIQPEKALTSKEMGEIVTAILDSGLVDKKVKMTITAKAILNKIRITRKGWISSLGEGLKKVSSSIKIEKKEKQGHDFMARRVDKPQSEVEALAQADKKGRVLGVSMRHIKSYRVRNSQNYAAAAFTRH
ncbi:MAG: M48 family metalloprotease [Alphaproteobacteria bacterium]|nr:M48 family metalloprotease [Alphaproteobacteria bacterium]